MVRRHRWKWATLERKGFKVEFEFIYTRISSLWDTWAVTPSSCKVTGRKVSWYSSPSTAQIQGPYLHGQWVWESGWCALFSTAALCDSNQALLESWHISWSSLRSIKNAHQKLGVFSQWAIPEGVRAVRADKITREWIEFLAVHVNILRN